jgi:hypothetical protein
MFLRQLPAALSLFGGLDRRMGRVSICLPSCPGSLFWSLAPDADPLWILFGSPVIPDGPLVLSLGFNRHCIALHCIALRLDMRDDTDDGRSYIRSGGEEGGLDLRCSRPTTYTTIISFPPRSSSLELARLQTDYGWAWLGCMHRMVALSYTHIHIYHINLLSSLFSIVDMV